MAAPSKNPYDKYKQTEINTANQGKLIVMLYDGAIKFLNIALENMHPKTYDLVNTNIIKAQDIITELMLSINFTDGGQVSTHLFNLYMYFKRRLLEANIQKDPEIVKEISKMLKDLRDAWDKISARETKTDKMNMDSKGSFSIEG
jgi:flagellar protein FliS